MKTTLDLKENVSNARSRLIEFRIKNSAEETSIHINALEIAICLTEFSLQTSPARPVSIEEEQWFNAGRYIDLVLGNSEWEDLVNLYFKIVEGVKRRNFFR